MGFSRVILFEIDNFLTVTLIKLLLHYLCNHIICLHLTSSYCSFFTFIIQMWLFTQFLYNEMPPCPFYWLLSPAAQVSMVDDDNDLNHFSVVQIPEFDNLYLDMNGIIHQCSHPNDDDVHFRISDDKIFTDVFHYLEVLFRIIKPRKVFFMAVDGVAPRAKMNQQRGRRFR